MVLHINPLMLNCYCFVWLGKEKVWWVWRTWRGGNKELEQSLQNLAQEKGVQLPPTEAITKLFPTFLWLPHREVLGVFGFYIWCRSASFLRANHSVFNLKALALLDLVVATISGLKASKKARPLEGTAIRFQRSDVHPINILPICYAEYGCRVEVRDVSDVRLPTGEESEYDQEPDISFQTRPAYHS